ncbi:MAG: hypothetical protein Fur0041_15830 [Bacteroidia bacterium]
MNNMNCTPTRTNRATAYRSFFPNVWDEFFATKDAAQYVPAVNISESSDNWLLEFNVAGFAKDDFKIRLEEDVLIVSGEHKTEKNEQEKQFSRREFRFGSFERKFRIAADKTEISNIQAKYENGILMVSIPKKKETETNQSLEIKID